ncbi:hypothetical protein GQ600_5998 [Phytophthora cactorum]|nr:hypothetical protein GQ600_5998 [Phytophthora cactorum]
MTLNLTKKLGTSMMANRRIATSLGAVQDFLNRTKQRELIGDEPLVLHLTIYHLAVRLRVSVDVHCQQNRSVVDLQSVALRSIRLRPRHRLYNSHQRHQYIRRSCLERDLHGLAIAFAHVEVSDTVSNVGLDAEVLTLGFGAKLFGGCDESADILLLGATENCCRLPTITPRPRNFGLVGIADIYGDAVIARWTRSSISPTVSAYTSVWIGETTLTTLLPRPSSWSKIYSRRSSADPALPELPWVCGEASSDCHSAGVRVQVEILAHNMREMHILRRGPGRHTLTHEILKPGLLQEPHSTEIILLSPRLTRKVSRPALVSLERRRSTVTVVAPHSLLDLHVLEIVIIVSPSIALSSSTISTYLVVAMYANRKRPWNL